MQILKSTPSITHFVIWVIKQANLLHFLWRCKIQQKTSGFPDHHKCPPKGWTATIIPPSPVTNIHYTTGEVSKEVWASNKSLPALSPLLTENNERISSNVMCATINNMEISPFLPPQVTPMYQTVNFTIKAVNCKSKGPTKLWLQRPASCYTRGYHRKAAEKATSTVKAAKLMGDEYATGIIVASVFDQKSFYMINNIATEVTWVKSGRMCSTMNFVSILR